MGDPVRRGRILLSSPIAFVPKPTACFPWTVCLLSATSGFILGLAVFLAWILSLE